MHGLTVKTAQSTEPLPAAGPRLIQAIDQALAHINSLAARDYEREGWPDHAKLWRELLNQSKEGSKRGIAPNILKGDLASPLGFKVTGRRWQLFLNWYNRHIEPSLTQLAERSKIPVLKAIRKSDPKGGFPETSESIYYLIFVDAEKIVPTTDTRQIASVGYREKLMRFISQIEFRGKSSIFSSVEERWRYGLSILLLSIFLLLLTFTFPIDANRWLFIVASVVFFLIGIFDLDGARKGKIR